MSGGIGALLFILIVIIIAYVINDIKTRKVLPSKIQGGYNKGYTEAQNSYAIIIKNYEENIRKLQEKSHDEKLSFEEHINYLRDAHYVQNFQKFIEEMDIIIAADKKTNRTTLYNKLGQRYKTVRDEFESKWPAIQVEGQ